MEDPVSNNLQSENSEGVVHKRVIAPQKSRESLFGTLLFAFMLLFVLASIGGIGWVVYSRWQAERADKSRLSIMELLNKSEQQTETPVSPDALPSSENKINNETNSSNNEAIISAAKKLEISVLNGGAAKGSAGTLADFLKKEGYLKTDMGNTLKDYAGVTIYYAASLEKEAEVIKESVVKKYPQAKILPADPKNKETFVSQVTIILGK